MAFLESSTKRLVLIINVHGMQGIQELLPASSCSCELARSWSDPHLTYSIRLMCKICDSRPRTFTLTAAEGDVDFECSKCERKLDNVNEGTIRILRRGEQSVKPGELKKALLEVELTGDYDLAEQQRHRSSSLVDLLAVVGEKVHKVVQKDNHLYEIEDLSGEEFSIDCCWTKAEWDFEPTYDLLGLAPQGDKYDSKKRHWPPGIPEEDEETHHKEDEEGTHDDEEGTGEEGAGEEDTAESKVTEEEDDEGPDGTEEEDDEGPEGTEKEEEDEDEDEDEDDEEY